MKTDFTFNARQKQVFEGCMLGDGGLVWEVRNCCFRNTDVHKEYLVWLQKQLGVEDISSVKPLYEDGFAYSYEFRTRVIPSIRDEHKRWYPYESRKGTNQNRQPKIIPKGIELTLIKLLFWYIGDGCYGKRDDIITFGNQFGFDTWKIFSKKVCRVLDVTSGVSINKSSKDSKGNQRYCLYLNTLVTHKFFDMVNSLGFDIPECYQYKFGR